MSEFKKCKVIMLSTKDITDIVKENITNKIKLSSLNNSLRWINQHLYITSDEKIEEGDYYVHTGVSPNTGKYETLNQCHKGQWEQDGVLFVDGMFAKNCRKIVATTDKDLKNNTCESCKQDKDYRHNFVKCSCKVPQIPQSFIKQYVEAGGKIDEIEILNEYIETVSGNYIFIKPIKVSWTREEVEELCRTALHTRFPGNMCMQEDADKWIANYIK